MLNKLNEIQQKKLRALRHLCVHCGLTFFTAKIAKLHYVLFYKLQSKDDNTTIN